MNKLQGDFSPLNGKVAIIVSRFNGFVVESLLSGAINTLERHNIAASNIDVIYVPGAFEIPLTAQAAAESSKYVAVIALGAIIRGATPHFDIVANESAKGLSQVALKYSIPVINGILTTNNIEQAIERSGTKAGNKGAEAAITAIEMVNLLGQLK